MALDKEQLSAVEHFKGPAMILAGPGSGKTTVITHRLKKLTQEYGVKPEKILVITFTKMAAIQMKERYLKLCKLAESDITFGTFHAVFFMILRQVRRYKVADIVTTSQQRDCIRMKLRAKDINVQDEQAFISDILSGIAKLKGYQKGEAGYISSGSDNELFMDLYGGYERFLESEHKVDFEDMMLSTYEILSRQKDILGQWQDRYEYILIDEFQDASPIQFEIVRLLAQKHNNIFVVGDDDQSIYGFRGAAPDVMKKFVDISQGSRVGESGHESQGSRVGESGHEKQESEEVKVYKLNTNYRCTGNIVKAATRIINMNKNRFFKDLKASREDGGNVIIHKFKDVQAQADEIARQIICQLNNEKGTIAVLTRTHMGAKEIIQRLTDKGVNINMNSGKNTGYKDNIYNHPVTLDLAAYVSIASGDMDRGNYLRVINKPMRYIDRMFFDNPTVCRQEIINKMYEVKNQQIIMAFKEFCKDMDIISTMSPYAGIMYILKKMGYEKYIYELRSQYKHNDNTRDIVFNLMKDAKSCISYKEFLDIIKQGQEDESKKGMVCEKYKEEGRLTFLTMHSAKGLEFETVYIPDVSEGVVPCSKATDETALEEERRLFYVAMTRAKEKLVISYADKRYNKYVQPSRYIRELHHCRSCIEFKH